MATSNPRRFHPWRFSLATLLCLITLLALPLAYIAQQRSRNARRWEVFRTLTKERAYFLLADGEHVLQETPEEKKDWRQFLFNEMPPIRRVEIGYGSGIWGREYSPVDDAKLQLLAHLTEIEEVVIQGAEEVTDESLRRLADLPNLKQFTADKLPNVTGAFLDDWGDCNRLESLTLTRLPALKGEHLAVLSKLSRLQSLTMQSCSAISYPSLQKVNLPGSLTSLTFGEYFLVGGPALSETNSSQDAEMGAAILRRWLEQTRLKSLDLNIPFSRAIASSLAKQTSLEWLSIHNAPLLDEDLTFLAKCPNLTTIALIGSPVNGSFLRAFPDSFPLQELILHSAPITEENAANLKRFPNLSTLDLSYTPIQGKFFAKLCPPALVNLRLEGTRFSDEGKTFLAAISCRRSVAYPTNWTAQDFSRYPAGALPSHISISEYNSDEAKAAFIPVNYTYTLDNELSELPLDRCPPDLMAPVLRLRELNRAEGLELQKRREQKKE